LLKFFHSFLPTENFHASADYSTFLYPQFCWGKPYNWNVRTKGLGFGLRLIT
jgi:hypothetical protein